MINYVLRRFALMIPTFFGVTLVCFFIMRMASADPVTADLEAGVRGYQVSQEALQQLRAIYHLDQPWYVQYGSLVKRLVTLDLGTRWQDGRAISEILAEALPVTLLLSVASLLVAYLIAIPIGVYSAVRQQSWSDKVITVFLFMLYSLPVYWVAIMLLLFLASGRYVTCGEGPGGCFPLQGYYSFEGFEQLGFWGKARDIAWHLVLPVVALSYASFASLSRYMRSGMLDVVRQDFIRTARAKGASERRVLVVHAMRNSILPIVTLLGLELPGLIGGAAIVETIFGIRGMGLVALEAVQMPDYPLVITIVAFTALLTMGGLLLSDLLYALVDPRIGFGGKER